MQLAARLNETDKVAFINKFVSEDDLINYLTAADIYISHYLNEAQITSGTLAYAIGAGAAVISTPYWHASELLDKGKGRLFNFKDESGLADNMNKQQTTPEKLAAIKNNAYTYGLN